MNARRKKEIEALAAQLAEGDAVDVARQLDDILEAERTSYRKYSRLDEHRAMEQSTAAQDSLTEALDALDNNDAKMAAEHLHKILNWGAPAEATPAPTSVAKTKFPNAVSVNKQAKPSNPWYGLDGSSNRPEDYE